MSEIHCDFKVDYKKLKIFEENQITDIKYPVILSIPHAGTVFPDEFLNYTSRTIEELRSNEDLFVSDLKIMVYVICIVLLIGALLRFKEIKKSEYSVNKRTSC